MISLEIDFSRRNMGIWVHIWDRNKEIFYEVDALFDTGAHTSAIDKNLFLNLGYDLDGATKSAISTATRNREIVDRVKIDKILLDEEQINFVLFNTYEFPLISHPVIIGMNIIRHFEVNMNFKTKLITMSENYIDSNDNYGTDIFGDWRADIKN